MLLKAERYDEAREVAMTASMLMHSHCTKVLWEELARLRVRVHVHLCLCVYCWATHTALHEQELWRAHSRARAFVLFSVVARVVFYGRSEFVFCYYSACLWGFRCNENDIVSAFAVHIDALICEGDVQWYMLLWILLRCARGLVNIVPSDIFWYASMSIWRLRLYAAMKIKRMKAPR